MAWKSNCLIGSVRRLTHHLQNILLAGALLSPAIFSGCAVRARYYDPVHSDYHRWGPAEREPYARWEVEGHRPHSDYQKLRKEDRQAYWNWRHDHH